MTHNISAMTRRILKWHDLATPEQQAEGLNWYQDARTFAGDLAQRTGHTVEQIAGVIATLSPQVGWAHNKASTTRAVEMFAAGTWSGGKLPDYPGYGASCLKAHRVLTGDLSAVSGPKVRAFFQAICGDLSMVTLDVWAARAARDEKTNVARAYADDELPGAKERRAMQEAYRRAAALRGIAPSECQAVVWVACRASARWVRPQHMDTVARARFWKKQARARLALGLALPYDWNQSSPMKVAAYG